MRVLPLLVAIPLAACSFNSEASGPAVPASGTGSARRFAVADFTGVALRGSDDVDVRVGGGFSVRAEGPSAELDKLRLVRDGSVLSIGRRANSGWDWGGHRKVTVFVTMPRITAAALAGSGNLVVDRAEGQGFDASNAGSGTLSVGLLRAPQVKLSLAGSGNIAVKGKVDRLTVSLAGPGNVAAGQLSAGSAKISAAGSGSVRAAVMGPASVSMVGSGNVDLGNGARCTISKIGSGAVHCGS